MTITTKKAAYISGISLIIMALTAFYSYGYVHSTLFASGNSEAALSLVSNSKGLLISGITGWILIIITDFLVSYGLYIYLKDVDAKGSLIAAVIRVIYTFVLIVAVSRLTMLLNTSNLNLVTEFEFIWTFGLIIFGGHLFAIGLLFLKSQSLSKIIGYLLVFAGLSYVVVSSLDTFTNLDSLTNTLETVLMLPMFVGEIGMAFWLLVKGHKKIVA